MSFLAKLELDGNMYNILECRYNFTQSIDNTGKPQGMPQGGEISIRIESTGKPDFLDWMLDHNKAKDGKIIFYRRDAMSKLQELQFEKGYCVYFEEHFTSESKEPLQISIRIVAKNFDVNGVSHDKNWR
ncbi:type VI secretion system tube protein TssD [Flavobacterium oreochromis]|uniref:Phage tail protein n=2 Tax=Flavobacterium TaxID=237 RepID=A0A246GEC1_9FLAO|nr:type VI secretion system tube protein TssD [Flavobacterium oreochromis]OWP79036.1 hypothetical protein BWG23_00385 [Flavobacterium oreochromis]OWP79742.1 hypothetical protein BWK62_00445 [Flavobacterium oreochromis]POR30812.1 hypothetical protein BWK58_00495 [Flavobacterium columnare]QYS87178.1 hypothetical protein JJC03_04315 [Flavobacterium oreochromis]